MLQSLGSQSWTQLSDLTTTTNPYGLSASHMPQLPIPSHGAVDFSERISGGYIQSSLGGSSERVLGIIGCVAPSLASIH